MEQGAFLPFYEQHKETLYHYACTLTSNAHQAEDALQNAWVSCLRQEEVFDALPPDKRLAWMSVVVKNAARSLWRQEQRYAPWDETWDMPAGRPPAHRRRHPSHAGAVPPPVRAEISVGMEQQGDRQAPGPVSDGGQHAPQPRPEAAPGTPARGGL